MNYTFTIIIPHKNTPDLLKICLNSIPQRDDTQIIVVDDNSDPIIVDFDNFPGRERENTTVIFDKSNKGAGHARNVALDQIDDTKWLIFADADDYFTSYLNEAMDIYRNSDYDMIYFKRHSVYVGTDIPATRHQSANSRVDELIKNGNQNIIRLKDVGPVCKFVKYSLVKKNNIRFEPIRFSNDVNFFVRVGHYTKNLKIDVNSLYVVTERKGSLVKIITKEALDCRYQAAIRASRFLESVGEGEFHTNLFSYCYRYMQIRYSLGIKCFFSSLINTPCKYWLADIKRCIEHI